MNWLGLTNDQTTQPESPFKDMQVGNAAAIILLRSHTSKGYRL